MSKNGPVGFGISGYGMGSYGGTVDEDRDEDRDEDDDSKMTNGPEVIGEVNADELTEFVDSRIKQNQKPPEDLAAEINEFITHPDQAQGLTEEDVRDLIEQNQKSPEDLAAELNEFISHPDPGLTEEEVRDLINEEGGSDGNDSNEDDSSTDPTDEDLSTEIQNVRLTNSPKHIASIDTGDPEGEYHPYGDWGVIVTVDQPVHWRSTVINAEEDGKTNLQIFEMDYSEGETYSLQEVHATRELDHDAGQQKVYPDVILPEGQFFICRDPDQTVPMREVDPEVNWEDFNQHNVPITVECSWRANADYQPGNAEYEKYKRNNWDQLYYYFGKPTFGFQGDQ